MAGRGRKSDRELGKEIRNKKANKKLSPGPYSNIESDLVLDAKLRPHISEFGFNYLGKYYTHDYGKNSQHIEFWDMIGGDKAIINVKVDDVDVVLGLYSTDVILAAIENSLNSYCDKRGNKLLGDVVISRLLNDPRKRFEAKQEVFFSLEINTNKNNIKRFATIRSTSVKNHEGIVSIKPRLVVV